MSLSSSEYAEVPVHKLKDNLSRYLRALESGQLRLVVIERYGFPVAVLTPYGSARKRREADL